MTVLLDLGDGSEPIPCRDAHQAAALRSLWKAAHTVFGKPIEESGLLDVDVSLAHPTHSSSEAKAERSS